MAPAQKPDLVFPRIGRVHLNWRGRQFSRLLAAEECASAVVMVVMLDTPCSEVECKTTGYPLHSHVSPFTSPPCVYVCYQVPNALYSTLYLQQCRCQRRRDVCMWLPVGTRTPASYGNVPTCISRAFPYCT